jgi:hypothetical protein
VSFSRASRSARKSLVQWQSRKGGGPFASYWDLNNRKLLRVSKRRKQPPGNFQWPRALLYMDNLEHREKPPITREEREAKKERARKDAEKALAAHKKEDDAFRANFERLKAERLAREAAETKS